MCNLIPWIFVRSLAILLACASLVTSARAQKPISKLSVPETVLFEVAIEYANPEGQHLQLDLARPKTGTGPFPAVVCIHGGGFRAGSRQGYDSLCLKLA